jgi:hypothetical protein
VLSRDQEALKRHDRLSASARETPALFARPDAHFARASRSADVSDQRKPIQQFAPQAQLSVRQAPPEAQLPRMARSR